MSRELSAKGMEDRKLVTDFLDDKEIDIVLSSPHKRAIDTISEFAECKDLDICIINDFRERKIDSVWIEDFTAFCKAQWMDFSYKLTDGESLGEVQKRNITALSRVLEMYKGKNIVIGSHGTALSTIINYYDKSFGYSEFEKVKKLMPWIVRFVFQDEMCIEIKQYNLFEEDLWNAFV